MDRYPGEPVTGRLREIQNVIPGEPTSVRHGTALGRPARVAPDCARQPRRSRQRSLNMSHISCWTQGMLTSPIAAGNAGSSFVPERSAWSLLARLRSGETAPPSLFSSLLRSDEPGGLPPAAAEVAQASRSHFRRIIIARPCNPPCLPQADLWVKSGPRRGRVLPHSDCDL